MKPVVSIIMPAYNRAYIIGTAIDSLLAQTNPHWELLVMDDGSSDDTRAVVQRYHDSRIQYHPGEHAGVAAARNRAVGLCQGDWVAYLDTDNELLPKYLEVMLDHFHRHPQASYGIPRGRYTLELYRDGRLVSTIDRSAMFPPRLTIQDVAHRTIPFEMNGFMHTRRLFDEGMHFDPELPGMEDFDLVLQMGDKHPQGFLYVPETLYAYHQRYGTDGLAAAGSYATPAHRLERVWRKHRFEDLLRGQTWHPAQANEWKERERLYQAGQLPPRYLFDFPDFWPESTRASHHEGAQT